MNVVASQMARKLPEEQFQRWKAERDAKERAASEAAKAKVCHRTRALTVGGINFIAMLCSLCCTRRCAIQSRHSHTRFCNVRCLLGNNVAACSDSLTSSFGARAMTLSEPLQAVTLSTQQYDLLYRSRAICFIMCALSLTCGHLV
jgi:hypothetical protein